jgi:hypothetical protein
MDIRKPIGQLFLLLGIILIAWGFISGVDPAHGNGQNLNLIWGSVITAFGAVMAWLARSAEKSESCSTTSCGCSKSK